MSNSSVFLVDAVHLFFFFVFGSKDVLKAEKSGDNKTSHQGE